MPIGVRTKLLQ